MARVILDGFRDYEEALAFAEWFGYSRVEVDTNERTFVVEADVVESRIETGRVEMDVTTHTLVDINTDFDKLEDEVVIDRFDTDYSDLN